MDPRVATTLKMAAFGLVALILGGFIMKHVKLSKKTERLASEMRTLASDTGFYRAPTVEAAQAALFKGIAMIHDAKALELEPSAYFDVVFRHEKKDKVGLDDEFEQPAREKLVRDTLLRAYQQAESFGFFDSPEHLEQLRAGKMPEVTPKPVVAPIIDPALSPGMEKIVPNLELRTASKAVGGPPTDLEVAAAKNLSADLYSARVIDSDADNRIGKHYTKRAESPAPQPPPAVPATPAPPAKAEP